jgi:hypothetical protein
LHTEPNVTVEVEGPSRGRRRCHRPISIQHSGYELAGITGAEHRGQAGVERLGIARRFAGGVVTHGPELSRDSRAEGSTGRMLHRLASAPLRGDR